MYTESIEEVDSMLEGMLLDMYDAREQTEPMKNAYCELYHYRNALALQAAHDDVARVTKRSLVVAKVSAAFMIGILGLGLMAKSMMPGQISG
jgi:hypothetical protein